MKKLLGTALTLCVVLQLASGADEPGWYRVELAEGNALSARLISDEGDAYVFSYQGAVLRVQKSGVKKLERLDAQEPGAEGSSEADQKRQDALRTAIETLAQSDNAVVEPACRLLRDDFEAARPLLHGALQHQNQQVRLLAVKILGEKGSAKDDLEPIAGRLSDPKPGVRLAAIMAVRAMGPDGLQALAQYLPGETVANNRKMAVKAFRAWRDKRAVLLLVGLVAKDPDEGVRGFAADALEVITGEKLGRNAEAWAAFLEKQNRRSDIERLEKTGPSEEPASPDGEGAGAGR